MQTHIVLAHPETDSFNGRLAEISRDILSGDGGRATLSDLHAMDFDPREGAQHYPLRSDETRFHVQTEQRFNAEAGALPSVVRSEMQHLLDCDLLVVHFPLWWFGMPAILKGWMDRVFVYGPMYRSSMRYDRGVCAGKKMIACVTTGADAAACSASGREGDTRMHLWPILFPYRYLGFEVLEPEVYHGVGGVAFIEGQEDGLSAMDAYSERWATSLRTLSARAVVPYNRDEDFDETKRLNPDAPVYSPFVRHE